VSAELLLRHLQSQAEDAQRVADDPRPWASHIRAIEQARQAHDARVAELLAANTREVERRRAAEFAAAGRFGMPAYQYRVNAWMLACFGDAIARDLTERNHRFLEEALELVQATGCTASEAHQLVDYVFGRAIGQPHQETGGVMVTLAALCSAAGLTLDAAAEDELARVWTKVEQIRAKQAAKPKHSPLPEAPA
jgi:hypothetical protein